MAVINEVVTTSGNAPRAVLYGGSVGPHNATELLSEPSTDDLFVGRAAWEASGFIEILKLCASIDGAGTGPSTRHSRTLPWTTAAALL
jgi:triosephosphate isomerase